MYGSGIYGQSTYGGENGGEPAATITPPLVTNAFTVYAPVITADLGFQVPLVTSAFQVFAPESVALRGRPLAEDIRIMSIKASEAEAGFHAALGQNLYPNMLNRERSLLFGAGSSLELFSISPAGETSLAILTKNWSARRIPTIESGALELWRIEIVDLAINWTTIKSISTVRISNALTGEASHLKVLQVENAMKPGHVYLLRCEAIDQS